MDLTHDPNTIQRRTKKSLFSESPSPSQGKTWETPQNIILQHGFPSPQPNTATPSTVNATDSKHGRSLSDYPKGPTYHASNLLLNQGKEQQGLLNPWTDSEQQSFETSILESNARKSLLDVSNANDNCRGPEFEEDNFLDMKTVFEIKTGSLVNFKEAKEANDSAAKKSSTGMSEVKNYDMPYSQTPKKLSASFMGVKIKQKDVSTQHNSSLESLQTKTQPNLTVPRDNRNRRISKIGLYSKTEKSSQKVHPKSTEKLQKLGNYASPSRFVNKIPAINIGSFKTPKEFHEESHNRLFKPQPYYLVNRPNKISFETEFSPLFRKEKPLAIFQPKTINPRPKKPMYVLHESEDEEVANQNNNLFLTSQPLIETPSKQDHSKPTASLQMKRLQNFKEKRVLFPSIDNRQTLEETMFLTKKITVLNGLLSQFNQWENQKTVATKKRFSEMKSKVKDSRSQSNPQDINKKMCETMFNDKNIQFSTVDFRKEPENRHRWESPTNTKNYGLKKHFSARAVKYQSLSIPRKRGSLSLLGDQQSSYLNQNKTIFQLGSDINIPSVWKLQNFVKH